MAPPTAKPVTAGSPTHPSSTTRLPSTEPTRRLARSVADDDSGTSGSSFMHARRVRIVTWNVQHARRADGRVDVGLLGRACAAFGADILALQEIEARSLRV